MIRDQGPRPTREMLSVRIPAYLYDRLRIYIASNRLNIQDFIESTVTEKLDQVDPVGKSREQAKQRAAEAAAPRDDSTRMEAIEAQLAELKELLTGRKRARG